MLHRHFRTTLGLGLLMALASVVALAGCGASAANGAGGLYGSGATSTATSGGAAPAQTACASSTAAICTRSVSVKGTTKSVLVTPSGKTLYYFTADSATSVACTSAGGCVTNWPPLLSSSSAMAPISGLTGTLATVSRSEGTQITYNGHPLYTYAADSAPGDDKGEGVLGRWFTATPDLAPSSSNGNGYGNGY
jgi:predicted lipoprotein with Yx(FWY)xxD motif